jgi:hypothetical protein
MFRFSLKWILAAMLYAAIAAAAFSQQSWVYADLLCGAALLALGYAVLLVIYARGPRQAAAAGFAVCTILLATCMLLAPDSVPMLRILSAAGIGQPPILPSPMTTAVPPTATFSSASSGALSFSAPSSITAVPAPNASAAWSLVPNTGLGFSMTPTFDISLKLRAANALALMLIGLAGCLLGLAAHRRAHRTASPPLASSQ